MRIFVFMILAGLSACSWFGSRKVRVPAPSELVVSGAPAGSTIFVDGMQSGEAASANDHPQVLNVTSGTHKVEIHLGDTVIYREDTYVAPGEHHPIRVLSGFSR